MSNTLTFRYKGRDAAGKVVKGKVEAPSEAAVVTRLRTMSISPTEITQAASQGGLSLDMSIGSFEKKPSVKDIAVMARQLATMTSSGLSLLRSLTVLAEQTENKALARTINSVRNLVETGSSFSDALARQGNIFPPLMIHLVRAGETGGFLDEALLSAASTFENDVKLRQTIRSAMTYPVVVLIMAAVAVAVMLIFVVPIFKEMFAGLDSALPIPTQILVTLSDNMFWVAPLVAVLIGGTAFWYNKNKNTDRVRSTVDKVKLKLPVFGPLFQKVAIARFARNLSTMTRSGVPILQSLAVVGQTSGNWVIEDAMHDVQESVRSGRSMSAPLAENPVFPSMVVQMIAVGEDAGSVDTMLDKLADFYDDEVQSTTEQLTSLIEPLLIAFMGVVIGGIIVSLYLPMFTLYDAIGAS